MSGIELKSSAFADHDIVPRRYSKDGDDVSPPLTWSGIPDGTAELVLVCEDPDAPSGDFLHWLVTGISPDSDGVAAGGTPAGGTPRRNGYGDTGWGGPRPPAGDPAHRYFFRLYALPEPLPRDVPEKEIRSRAAHLATASGTLVGLYQR
ncbi:YbhB/YbcL family Raf kinase inhibitor-like protein [Streptomyces sp. SCUT-3]|uniref:YbhB/YbcL family Raf kinase inhibitor-like protein n=1 Tax=Streptomyces TaxID=1883 RepID=UPI0015FC02D7|nr:YbhB/YbcL family Raf kinase inhibitor-like protein [Streptomyces sp. SCUT-3]QMV24564.1 YbhB/YbcL family Raf kinase inhibitor-like protein [Streptomyces sp. SCUT-3]